MELFAVHPKTDKFGHVSAVKEYPEPVDANWCFQFVEQMERFPIKIEICKHNNSNWDFFKFENGRLG